MFGISSAATGKQRNLVGIITTLARTPWLQFNPVSLMNSNKGVFGVNLGHMRNEIDRIRSWADQVLDLASKGVLKPRIAHAFPFDKAAEAHSYIQDRQNIGKVLLIP
jgi:NADPH:quinone reductase-like Zn-dependent oxidoreductase